MVCLVVCACGSKLIVGICLQGGGDCKCNGGECSVVYVV